MDGGDVRSRPPVYSIGAVAKMLDVPPATLRTWQERYEVVVPERSDGGQRLYSRDQVEQLRFVADQVAAGLSPADAHRLLRDRLAERRPLTTPDRDSGGALLILLAERDPYAADFSEYFLRTEGYGVELTLAFDDALARAEGVAPDLAVVDLMISTGRGLELCRRLRERGDTPILALSSLALRDRALAEGASAFLPKPIEPLHLVSVVKDLLGRSAYLRREKETS